MHDEPRGRASTKHFQFVAIFWIFAGAASPSSDRNLCQAVRDWNDGAGVRCVPACEAGWAACGPPAQGCATLLGTADDCARCGDRCVNAVCVGGTCVKRRRLPLPTIRPVLVRPRTIGKVDGQRFEVVFSDDHPELVGWSLAVKGLLYAAAVDKDFLYLATRAAAGSVKLSRVRLTSLDADTIGYIHELPVDVLVIVGGRYLFVSSGGSIHRIDPRTRLASTLPSLGAPATAMDADEQHLYALFNSGTVARIGIDSLVKGGTWERWERWEALPQRPLAKEALTLTLMNGDIYWSDREKISRSQVSGGPTEVVLRFSVPVFGRRIVMAGSGALYWEDDGGTLFTAQLPPISAAHRGASSPRPVVDAQP